MLQFSIVQIHLNHMFKALAFLGCMSIDSYHMCNIWLGPAL